MCGHDPADVLMVEDDPGDALMVHLAAASRVVYGLLAGLCRCLQVHR